MTTLLIILVAAVSVIGGLWLVATANRLDRLHVRVDAGWAALDAALSRRAVVARAVAAAVLGGAEGRRLLAGAERAEHADRAGREEAENALTLLLDDVDTGALPVELAGELDDAGHRVVIARRVYNDAVRDVLSLRRRRKVRYFKLAGTAPLPLYFEIAEPESGHRPGLGVPRPSARIILLDADQRVLLFNGHDPANPEITFWFTAGGGIDEGERPLEAAIRELREETGFEPDVDRFVGPVWRRKVRFDFDGTRYDGDELFFLVRLDANPVAIDTAGFTRLEIDTVDGHRWWTVEELRHTNETVYPVQLGELLPGLLAADWDGELRPVH